MTVSTIFRRISGVVLCTFAMTLPHALAAQTPSAFELRRVSPLGAYLAGRHAESERDAAAAALYYRSALRADPRNGDILYHAFLSFLAGGQVEEALRLADRVTQIDRKDGIVRLVLGVRAIKQKQYAAARKELAQSVRGPITDLTATLLSGWASVGSSESRAALENIDRVSGPEWYTLFKALNSGLIVEMYGKRNDAKKYFEQAYKLAPNELRVVEAYGGWLARNGAKDKALSVFQAYDRVVPRHPLIKEEIEQAEKGAKIPLLVGSPQEGAAEVLYGLGSYLGSRGGEDIGLLYMQLALYLSPSHPMALLTLGDLYSVAKKPELAISMYERVPASSPLKRNADVQRALNLNALDRPDDAKALLEKRVASEQGDLETLLALGSVQRARNGFSECADTYSKAIDTVTEPKKSDWTMFYFRGICLERSKQWSRAEPDFKKALQLFPDQPQVLNYLGYSWIDQGINLDAGMDMIRKAVSQKPDDGYFVDSLGWAYYRVGNYAEAVIQMERAVELRPEDPTLNDHLGDVYWRAGRTIEARFQWAHARDFKPEPDELAKIENKLKFGLPDETSSAAQAGEKAKKPDEGG